MQALAGAGYGVILLNPRGGSGYGQEFVASILNNYGDEDYQDLLNGTDYVLENYPKIDPDRVYVAGGSYGDRKSTRLNSSHVSISYAVFCLKKKNPVKTFYFTKRETT